MDLNEAVTLPPEPGETDMALVSYCASLLHVSPASLLMFILEGAS